MSDLYSARVEANSFCWSVYATDSDFTIVNFDLKPKSLQIMYCQSLSFYYMNTITNENYKPRPLQVYPPDRSENAGYN